LQHVLVNPDFTARCADFGRHILEEVNVTATLHFMGDRRGFQLATTDSAALVVGWCGHRL